MDFAKFLRGEFTKLAIGALDSKLNGADITRELDRKLDKSLGEKKSEKIQLSSIRNLLKEMITGLCEEDPKELRIFLHNWIQDIKKLEG